MTTHLLKHLSHQLNTTAPIINKYQNINIETNISEKLEGYVKIDTFDTFYESFLEFKYFVSSKLENFK